MPHQPGPLGSKVAAPGEGPARREDAMTSPALVRHPGSPDGLAALLSRRRAPEELGVVHAEPMPRELLDELTRGGLEGLRERSTVSWEHAASRTALFGIGVAARYGASRGAGNQGALDTIRALRLEMAPGIAPAAAPRLFGGLTFDPGNPLRDARWDAFGDWQFVVPAALVVRSEGEYFGTLCYARGSRVPLANTNAVAPGLDLEDWKSAVAAARDEIQDGRYDKTVLARQQCMSASATVPEALGRLSARFPGCFVFHFDAEQPGGGAATWLAASPERLVSLRGGIARADSLAGSCRRGSTPDEDRVLADGLLYDPKERQEHAFVVEAIAGSLAPYAGRVEYPPEPRIMQLANIQHLHTPVCAHVRPGVTVLDLVAAMHPTPAVGGWPREAGVDAIRRLEAMDRGWYAAPFGWVDFNGDGEFAVALRSALVSDGQATLFAGAGIVANSDPEREAAEIGLKFRPVAGALGGNGAWT